MAKIVLFGVFGSGNFGNDASLEAALYHIKKYQPDTEVICVCQGPREISSRYGIHALPMSGVDVAERRATGGFISRIIRPWLRLIHEIFFWLQRPRWFRPGDKFIVAGTGAVDDMGIRRPWHAPYELYKWCKAAEMGGAQVIFLSVGVGPILKRVNKFLMLGALRIAHYRSYRDVTAFNYLQSLGYDTSGDFLYPDLVFSMPKESLPIPMKNSSSPKVVGLGMINYYGWIYEPGTGEKIYQEYMSKMKDFAFWLLRNGFTIRLLIGDIGDRWPAQNLVDFVNREGEAHWRDKLVVQEITNVRAVFDQIAQTDFIVASRFHNVLCALMLERPVISLGYHEKHDYLMKEMGLVQFCNHIEHFTNEQLLDQFNVCIHEIDQITRQIHERLDDYRDLLNDQYKMLFS